MDFVDFLMLRQASNAANRELTVDQPQANIREADSPRIGDSSTPPCQHSSSLLQPQLVSLCL
jgi:hypothetical protein